MTVTVQLPPVLRTVMGGARTVEAEGDTIAAVLKNLAAQHPHLALHFFDEQSNIRRNIVFLSNGVLVRAPQAQTHAIKDGDEILLTNALAGG
ncbi:MAG: molybdopterin synthase sulfur carrier subunit [Alphaproteobacteria bacterium]|nr:molybdopterin synthase sulfur carrier subunit [Alphaproteobacteria bacterium]